MYTVIYLFRVPKPNVAAFSRVQQEAGEIYKQYGALDDKTLAPVSLEANYGCSGFSSVTELREDEELFVGLSCFRNRTHHDEVMAKVNADAQIDALYTETLTLIDMSRVVRGEFEEVS